jgi:hypothetical protein
LKKKKNIDDCQIQIDTNICSVKIEIKMSEEEKEKKNHTITEPAYQPQQLLESLGIFHVYRSGMILTLL